MAESHHIFHLTPELHRLSEMVFVEGGTFRMGSEEDDKEAVLWKKPAHDYRPSDKFIVPAINLSSQ